MLQYDRQKLTLPKGYQLNIIQHTDSTNSELIRAGAEGAKDKTVLLAHRQSEGKGSRGRSFFSPEGGIYLSILIRDLPAEQLCLLTPLTAVAVLRSLRPHTDRSLAIKWVNDIYLDGKKVCGILTENRFMEGSCFSVIGIGINLCPPKGGFPDGLIHPAASLLTETDSDAPTIIVRDLLHHFDTLLSTLPSPAFLEEYKKECCTLQQFVTLRKGTETIEGKAIDILPNGALLLELTDGQTEAFGSGEITSQLNRKEHHYENRN